MTMTNQLMTADELLALPPDGRTELVEGKLVVTDPGPSYRHNRISGQLYFAFRRWTEEAPGRGEAGLGGNVRLDQANLYCPDVWWVREGRQPGVEDIYRDDPPDLVVEVRAPSTWRHDQPLTFPRRLTVTRYRRHGGASSRGWLR
jgi:Uma2 family endonuclease